MVPWYEYEFIIEDITADNEEGKNNSKTPDYSDMMKEAKSNMPKAPKMPSFKLPKF